MQSISLTLLPTQRYQTIDGFGANINPVGHWDNGRLIPTLDLLIDDLGATIFRLDPFGFSNWVDPENATDRSVLHTDTYARVYRSQPFQDAWSMARYFNQKGIQFILNVSGIVPRWMCAADGQTLTDLEAYADLLTSLAHWVRYEEHITFRLFGPFNETDLGPPEGPYLQPADTARVLALLGPRFAAVGLSDVRFVVADQGHYNLDFLTAIGASPESAQLVEVAGMHCYSDFSFQPVQDFIAEHALPWRNWLTEYGDLDQTGEREWYVALASTRRLLRALREGVQAALIWDAYDNWHGHDASWSIYGILRKSIRNYTPKKRYYAAKHAYRFVPPGSVQIGVEHSDKSNERLSVTAFQTEAGDISLVGLNTGEPFLLDLTTGFATLSDKTLHLYLTTRELNCELAAAFPAGKQVQITIPADSIFTLTTYHNTKAVHNEMA